MLVRPYPGSVHVSDQHQNKYSTISISTRTAVPYVTVLGGLVFLWPTQNTTSHVRVAVPADCAVLQLY
jgi:hypothetical protein